MNRARRATSSLHRRMLQSTIVNLTNERAIGPHTYSHSLALLVSDIDIGPGPTEQVPP
jgi:hypothetical protein